MFEYFDAIACINLAKRNDRWILMQEQFTRLGIKATRFDAIEHSDGWRGCRDSHINLIRQAKENNIRKLLVLEDDITFIEYDDIYLNKAFESLPPDWELLYLNATATCVLARQNHQYLYQAQGCKSSCSIAYHYVIFNQLLHDYEDGFMEMPIDMYLLKSIQPRHKSYVTSRLCTLQNSGYSDIEKTHVDYSYVQRLFKRYLQ